MRLLTCLALTASLLLAARPALSLGLVEPPESVGLSSERLARATELLQAHVDAGEIAGAVAAVSRRGKLVFLRGVGVQDVESQAPMQPDTVFRIYSMAKTPTAVAAMRLVERGELQLNEPVSKYIPEFANMGVTLDPDALSQNLSAEDSMGGTRPPSREITIRDLLQHTDGLSHRWSPQYRARVVHSRHYTLERVARNVAAAPMMEDPGTKWRYGIGPTVLARVVEVVSGQSYADYLDEHVFGPIGMASSGYAVAPDEASRLASLYRTTDYGGISEQREDPSLPYTKMPALFDGATNMLSSAPDYLRLGQMLLNNGELDGVRVLSRKTIEKMTANHLPPELLPMQIQDSVYVGYGWGFGFGVITNAAEASMLVSNGELTWGGAAGTRFWVDREEQMVVVLMVQIMPHFAYDLGDRFRSAIAHAVVD